MSRTPAFCRHFLAVRHTVSPGDGAMRLAVLMVSLLGLIVGNPLVLTRADEQQPVAVRFDDSNRGELAFAPGPHGPWKVARPGETLPLDAYLRTSATAPCRLQIGNGVLQLEAESRAHLETTRREITLIAGRAFVQSLSDWSVVAGELKGTLAAETSVEVAVEMDQRVAGKVLVGAVEIAGVEPQIVVVKSGQGVVREPQTTKLDLTTLASDELKRLRALAGPARKPQGLGQLVVNDAQSDSPVRLNLARYHVNVVLHPPVALVQIDQSFYNPYPRQEEGTFIFNLPEGASVSRFAMYTTPSQLVEGELIERGRASNIYQSIVSRKRDPAILEQIGGNLFRMRVFPIFAQDTKRILLDYTVPIVEQDEGRFTFELPLMSDLEPVWDFALTGTIRGPNVAATAHSPSHSGVKFATDDQGAVRFDFHERSYRTDSAFVLGFQQRPVAEAAVRSFVPPAKPGGLPGPFVQEDKIVVESGCHFLATVNPSVLDVIGGPPVAGPSPVDFLILADTSGTMAHRVRLRQVVRTIAGALRPEDRFRLGCVDIDFRGLTDEWIAADKSEAGQALGLLDREFFLGSRDYVASFSNAAKSLPPAEKGRRRMVVYVGDEPYSENQAATTNVDRVPTEKEIAALAATLAQADIRFGAVLLDNEPSGRLLMEKLATATGGRIFLPGAAASSELFDWALAGCPSPARIVSIKAEGADDENVFAPTAWTPGRVLQIFGKRKAAGPMKLALSFERDGKIESREWNLTLKNDLDDLFVGRLWAQRKLDQLRGAPNRVAVERQIITLSQEWTLLSPLTAFLVLESEAEYPRYGITRRTRHQYWKPDDALVEKPLPPEAVAALQRFPKIKRLRDPRTITADRYDRALASARLALRKQAPNRALMILGNVVDSAYAADSQEFTRLQEAALEMLARGDLLRGLGPERGWFDRRRPIGFPSATSDLVRQLLHGQGTKSRDDDPWHGAMEQLAQPPVVEMTVEKFIDWIQALSGIPVYIDRPTLTDEGVALDQPVSLRGMHVMSLDSMLKHALKPIQLTTVVDHEALMITTSAKAGEKFETRVYPVADLLLTDPPADFSLLANPDLDRHLLDMRLLNENIDRRLSVDFVRTPLEGVVDFLNEKLDGNILIDRATLTDEGVPLDIPITLKMQNVPARRILQRLCEPHQLDTILENEAVIITTAAKAGETLETRVHSAVGIVFELPHEMVPTRTSNPWRGRGPSGGGMMGGMGFGGFAGGGFSRGMAMGGMGMGGGFAGGAFPGGAGATARTGGAGNSRTSSGTAVSESAADGDVESPSDSPSEEASKDDADPDSADGELDALSSPWNPGPLIPWVRRGPFIIDGYMRDPGHTPGEHPNSANSTMNLIKTTIQPDSWDDLSGPGCEMYFPQSVAFALRQTQAIHAEIEKLLDRVGEVPTAYGEQTGWRPARVPEIGPNDIDRWEMQTLMNVLKAVVEPDSWEDLSGPGSIFPVRPKLAYSVRQTLAIHGDIRNLLTLLRRAKYLARQGKTWKSDGLLDGPWFSAALAINDLPNGPKQSALPDPEPEELKALSILAEPFAGVQTWRTVSTGERPSQTTVIRQGTDRGEFEFEGRVARIAGDDAAIAYPGITLVERGSLGEAVRRIVDGRLPWFPHRSRQELARIFIVRVADENEQTVTLRLALPAAAPGNEILVTVSRKDGLPTRWESRLSGETALRLRFDDRDEAGGRPIWKTIVAEDGSGREVERWTLADFTELKEEIPPVDAGWEDYVVVDLRDQEREALPVTLDALQAMRLRDWKAADRALNLALDAQPGQPLLLILKAWTVAQREGAGDLRVVGLLKQAARTGTAELLTPLAERSFATLPDRVIYEILLEQPAARRALADCENLTRVALRAGKPEEALGHLKAAIEKAGLQVDVSERERLLVEVLLDTRHAKEAVAGAKALAARPRAEPEQIAALAETLYSRGEPGEAKALMQQVLDSPRVVKERRQRLLHRRADMESGLVRWRTLLEAMETLSAGSPLRGSSAATILNELTDARQVELLAILSEEARDPWLKSALKLRQAEFYAARSNSDSAADIGWNLYEAGQLPEERAEWLCGQLAAAGRHDRLVLVVEDRLRSGTGVGKPLLDSLARAYDAVGRPDAARRARSNAGEVKPSRNRAKFEQEFQGAIDVFR